MARLHSTMSFEDQTERQIIISRRRATREFVRPSMAPLQLPILGSIASAFWFKRVMRRIAGPKNLYYGTHRPSCIYILTGAKHSVGDNRSKHSSKGELVSKLRYPGLGCSGSQAISCFGTLKTGPDVRDQIAVFGLAARRDLNWECEDCTESNQSNSWGFQRKS